MYSLNIFEDGLRTISLWLCNLIYGLIIFVFRLFEKLATTDILKDGVVEDLISRLSLIIGLFMVFVVTFSFIKYIINPDEMVDKNKGAISIVKKIIIAIVLLGSTSFLFDMAFKIQNVVIDSGFIGKVILGKEAASTGEFGSKIASDLFMTFYRLNEEPIKPDNTYYNCSTLVDELADEISLSGGDLSLASYCLLEKNKYYVSSSAAESVNDAKKSDEKIKDYIIDFDGLLAIVAGGFFVYLGFLWTIQIGVRMFQLAYLQIVSPIPILMYITPKGEEKLNKWIQQCITTFLDLFLRLAIIYFGLLLFDVVREFDFSELFGGGLVYNLYAKVVLIIAIFTFINKIPKLLQEIFPSMGGAAGFNYGLKPSDETKKVLGAVGGAATAGAIGLVGGGVKGFAGGVFKGALGGAKGKKISEIASARAAQNLKNKQAARDGSTFRGRMDARLRNAFGIESRTQELDNQIHDIDTIHIRPIDDSIGRIDNRVAEINNDKLMDKKRSNDSVLAAMKAAKDEARSELLKEDAGAQAAEARLNYVKANVGKIDVSTGRTITTADVAAQTSSYETYMSGRIESYINSHSSDNAEIARSMQIISDESGRSISNYGDMNAAKDAAKADNASIAGDIVKLETEKRKLEEEKSTLERQKSSFEKQKSDLERQKEKPQADETAVKK